jgi:hypothetical protein
VGLELGSLSSAVLNYLFSILAFFFCSSFSIDVYILLCLIWNCAFCVDFNRKFTNTSIAVIEGRFEYSCYGGAFWRLSRCEIHRFVDLRPMRLPTVRTCDHKNLNIFLLSHFICNLYH